MNKPLIEKFTALATELRGREDMTYEEGHAAECALVAVQHLEASEKKRAAAAPAKGPAKGPAKTSDIVPPAK